MIVMKNTTNVNSAKFSPDQGKIEICDTEVITILKKKNVKKQLIQPEMDVYHPLSKRWKNVKPVVVICNSL